LESGAGVAEKTNAKLILMEKEKWQEISQIFNAALEKKAFERIEFLNDACRNDTELREEIETLLAANDEADSFIDSPKAALTEHIPQTNLKKGQKIGAFQIIEKIGAGGMGEVYLAKDLRLNRQVALKFLTLADENSTRRFLREAQAAAALEHPHICTIHEIGSKNGLEFIVMQYIEGVTLSEKIKQGNLSLVDTLDFAVQIAQALAEAHKRGIIHRDIKPANIIVSANKQIKVLDFGLAKKIIFDADKGESSFKTLLSQPGMIVGTVSYMSPEQIRGKHIDSRTDLWSLGVVLYEMISGKTPFAGENTVEKLAEILYQEPSKIDKIPAELGKIIKKSLQKESDKRYQTAEYFIRDLKHIRQEIEFAEQLQIHATSKSSAPDIHETLTQFLTEHPELSAQIGSRKPTWKHYIFYGSAILLLVVGGLFWWKNHRFETARENLKKVGDLAQQEKNFEAFDLALQVENALPNDENLAKILPIISDSLSVSTVPAGAKVYLRRFQPDKGENFPDRQEIGITPIENLRIARGDYILEIEKDGFAKLERTISGKIPRIGGSFIESPPLKIEVNLIEANKISETTVFVPGGEYALVNWSRSTSSKVNLGDFLIDKFEVTNAEFKEFINAGGYVKSEFWKVPFFKDGKEMPFAEAMRELKDKTGLPAPRSWVNQNFPEGKENFPVTDITWYEATAYAEFRGKKLPTVFQWEKAARNGMFDPRYNAMPWGFIRQGETTDNRANFRGTGTVAVTENEFGMSPFGAFNMAGNVSEWNLNQSPEGFVTSGGAWNDLAYSFGDYGIYPPFYTANRIGFRCVTNLTETDQGTQMIPPAETPVYKPSNDADFKFWLTHYEYDKKSLNANVTETLETDEWQRERIVFNGENGEQAIAYLYLPKNFARPLQVIHYVPPGDVVRGLRSLNDSIEMFAAPFIKSGRAVFAVVLKGYIERPFPPNYDFPQSSTVEFRKQVVNWITDLRRGIDYLETRNDLDKEKISFLGVSNGANLGLILTAVETRYKTLVFESAGLEREFRTRIAETSPINFASQVKIQKLIINGRYDETFPYNIDAKPLFQLLREPKKIVIYDGGHIPTLEFFVPTVNNWLDETIGSVAK
jgi:serine/threonine protein kinase/formylglycine-generating enzyme required for sulfatase activity/dienelactone hydrolase